MSHEMIEIGDPTPQGGGYKQGAWLARQHQLMGYHGDLAYFLAGEFAGRTLATSEERIAFFIAYRDVTGRPTL